jgi:Tfp pilus assembly PilM family ATPase
MMKRSLLAASAPTVAVGIAPRQVTAISMSVRGEAPLIAACASEPLPAGAVVPNLNGTNIADRAPVAHALSRTFERLGLRPRRVALVIPDCVAKVSIVRFDKVPTSATDLSQLIRWQVRKAAPFRIEDAQVTFAPGAAVDGGGREFIVAVARRDVIVEYEQAALAAGASAGLVDLATFDLINVVLAAGRPSDADWLLVNVTPEYSTMGILRGSSLIFYRNRIEEGDGNLTDLVHQTAMYYEDRLSGKGFERVLLSGAPDAPGIDGDPAARAAEAVSRKLEERLGVSVETIDVRKMATFADRIAVDASLASSVAPLIGVLVRERLGG